MLETQAMTLVTLENLRGAMDRFEEEVVDVGGKKRRVHFFLGDKKFHGDKHKEYVLIYGKSLLEVAEAASRLPDRTRFTVRGR